MIQKAKSTKQPTAVNIIKFEKNIISCMLNDPTIIDDVIAKLELKDFYDQKLRCVFQAIIDIHSQGKPVDHLTVCEYISKNNELASITADFFLDVFVGAFSLRTGRTGSPTRRG